MVKKMAKAKPKEDKVNPKDDKDTGKVKGKIRGLFRASPLFTTVLVGIRKDAWEGKDEKYVHLENGSPTPYKLQFMNTPLEGSFILNCDRLGRFRNVGDKHELKKKLIKEYLDKKIVEVDHPEYNDLKELEKIAGSRGKDKFEVIKEKGTVYELVNREQEVEKRVSALLKSLAVLRGGSKQAQFATDTSPKFMILAGMTCGNMIFNSLFKDNNSDPTSDKSAIRIEGDCY